MLAELQYIIRVEPRRFGKDMKREITDELNRKFANKVCTNIVLLPPKHSFCMCPGDTQCWIVYSSV